ELSESDPEYKAGVVWCLGMIGGDKAKGSLFKVLLDKNILVYSYAAKGLGNMAGSGDPEIIRVLIGMLGEKESFVIDHASSAIRWSGESAIGPLSAALRDDNWQVRFKAAGILKTMGSGAVARGLVSFMGADNVEKLIKSGCSQAQLVYVLQIIAESPGHPEAVTGHLKRVIAGFKGDIRPDEIIRFTRELLSSSDPEGFADRYIGNPDRDNKDGGKQKNGPGGIDFRAIPVAGQPAPAPAFMPQLQQLAANSKIKDLDAEWILIREDMLAPEMPYSRIKEYIAVCMYKNDSRRSLEKVFACLIDILRMEEDQALPTHAELKTILAFLG
ncbi:MAG: hypothetical protein WCY10_06870, partial [Candidatus Omnitrophota bacterium]